MNDPNYCKEPHEECSSNPYRVLYIYHFEGRLAPSTKICTRDFIGNWEEDSFSFLFFSAPSHNEVENLLAVQPQLTLLDNYRIKYDDWQGTRLDLFRVGRFLIVPPWQKIRNNENICEETLSILLDPGVVFGTGTHSTTHDCLEALETAFRYGSPDSALDLGTGTGLLAVAAARLGSNRILAAKTAEKNIRFNHMQDRVMVVQGKAEEFIDWPADLVIANIHYDVMERLIYSDGFLGKKWFILSGILRREAKIVSYRLAQRPCRIIKCWKGDGIWNTFFGEIC